jgi:hypothetical protein
MRRMSSTRQINVAGQDRVHLRLATGELSQGVELGQWSRYCDSCR